MKKRLRSFPAAVQNARALRKNTTMPERLLWEALRDRRLGGWKLRRQHPIGQFVIDFFCREKAVAIEVDGGVHDEPDTASRDLERTRFLQSRGISIIRFTNRRVIEDLAGVLQEKQKAMEEE